MNGPAPASGPSRIDPAPFHNDPTVSVPECWAVWRLADDGMKLRLGLLGEGGLGTILLLQGRTEYLEKYREPAAQLARIGYSVVSVDFRGQGLSGGRLGDPSIGHVERFADYQNDVRTLARFAEELGLPKPWFLIAHSLGGAVGLRALHEGLSVSAAVFSAPLWGINIQPLLRPVAWGLGFVADRFRMNNWVAPGTSRLTYVREADPEDNFLTTDPTVMARMRAQLDAQPELELGGPNVPWLYRALCECRALRQALPPPVPCLTFVPEHEEIVRADAMRQLSEKWPEGHWVPVPGGKHETMMESPDRQDLFFTETASFLQRNR